MVRIEKDYVFDGPEGKVGLLDLFDGRRQLILYHFMFGPNQTVGCDGCSMLLDNVGHPAHLHARDTTFVAVSRAPIDRIEAYFTNGRGLEALGSNWSYLDLTPLGRQERWEDSPAGYPQTAPYQWWRRHDEYEEAEAKAGA
jgi:predicted dithiol-disulfide oxidoreductase (DUF899 family)